MRKKVGRSSNPVARPPSRTNQGLVKIRSCVFRRGGATLAGHSLTKSLTSSVNTPTLSGQERIKATGVNFSEPSATQKSLVQFFRRQGNALGSSSFEIPDICTERLPGSFVNKRTGRKNVLRKSTDCGGIITAPSPQPLPSIPGTNEQ